MESESSVLESKKLFILSDWIFDSYSKKDAAILKQHYCLVQTNGDGNCFFQSVHIGLKSIVENPYSIYELRNEVAMSIKEDRKEGLQALDTWKVLLHYAIQEKDQALQKEFAHALPLVKGDISESSIQHVYENMLDPNLYWGDQYALNILELRLNVKLIVLKKSVTMPPRLVIQRNIVHEERHYRPMYCIILFLHNEHYMPLIHRYTKDNVVKYVTCFKVHKLPCFIENIYNAQ